MLAKSDVIKMTVIFCFELKKHMIIFSNEWWNK